MKKISQKLLSRLFLVSSRYTSSMQRTSLRERSGRPAPASTAAVSSEGHGPCNSHAETTQSHPGQAQSPSQKVPSLQYPF